jgi:hypothetical protein
MGPGCIIITGLSPAAIQNFLLQSADLIAWTANDMARRLGLDREHTEQFIAALAAAGYVEPLVGRRVWHNTRAGDAAAFAPDARRVARMTARRDDRRTPRRRATRKAA